MSNDNACIIAIHLINDAESIIVPSESINSEKIMSNHSSSCRNGILHSFIYGDDPEKCFFSSLPVIETDHLLLRKFRRRDAADVFAAFSDPAVARYVLWEPHRSISDSKAYIRAMHRLYRNCVPSSWAVVLKDTGHVIGSIGLMWYDPVNHSAEVGYSLARSCWNHGFGTEALNAVLHKVFAVLPLNRIEAQHDVRNPASGRVMEKCGMHREGILRSRVYNKSEYVDVVLYSILASDQR